MKMIGAAIAVALVGVLVALSMLDVWPALKRSVTSGNPAPAQQEEVAGPQVAARVYHYDESKDKSDEGENLCSRRGIVALGRMIPESDTLEESIQIAVEETLRGDITEEEAAQGITTAFPLSGLDLVDVQLENDKAVLTFRDPQNATTGGSCRAALLWYQIEATVLQFEEVNDVEFRPLSLFQP